MNFGKTVTEMIADYNDTAADLPSLNKYNRKYRVSLADIKLRVFRCDQFNRDRNISCFAYIPEASLEELIFERDERSVVNRLLTGEIAISKLVYYSDDTSFYGVYIYYVNELYLCIPSLYTEYDVVRILKSYRSAGWEMNYPPNTEYCLVE